uniref:Uncharacterized protein n=1 Tax=Timema monikensis TaxID=170555 RepID=A0A7R9E9L2_9NEOP|nr:unnamed protein product [Timema monikensis]
MGLVVVLIGCVCYDGPCSRVAGPAADGIGIIEETIEHVKTEPRGDDDDECYKYGRPRIKTEDDSNLPGYFNDEPECSQKSDLNNKSLWDGFLPIKEQVKDEPDSSDYEEKIVKTEMKFYDSSLGVKNSNLDHFNVDVKSQGARDLVGSQAVHT